MRKLIAPFLLLILIVTVFHSWFLPGLLSSFDFPYFSPLMMKGANLISYAWGWHVGLDGLSRFMSPYSWVMPLIFIPQSILGKLGLSWSFIERMVYLYPLLILLIFSPIVLIKYIFPKNNFYLLSILVFSFNTYALMLFGGEIFLALAYSLIPVALVLYFYLLVIDKSKTSKKYFLSLITGLVLALQTAMEIRFTYVTLFIVAIFLIYYLLFKIKNLKEYELKDYFNSFLFIFLIPGLTVLLLHAFWIIPSLLHGGSPVGILGSGYSTFEAVKYLSFAKFEDAVSLLHPNWPENIFGKVGFLKPEFLLLPILAFSSLLFVIKIKDKKERFYILFFTFLGVIGIFLSKGANDPFGNAYLWMFKNIPGFILFRDPSKWYPLIAISYSVLIPFSIWKIYEWIKSQEKFKLLQNLFVLLFVIYFLFLIRPAIFGQLGGMFKATIVPQDYVKLEKFLSNQPGYSRTVWVPTKQRFGYYSNLHPEISAQILFNIYDNKKLLDKLSSNESEKVLQEISAKYVIIPNDSEGEIFLDDRRYSEKEYQKTVNTVSKTTWLKKVTEFGKIKVFEISNFKDHFWLTGPGQVDCKYISQVEYQVVLSDVKKDELLVFSEGFDSHWQALGSKSTLSQKYGLINSFRLEKDGSYSLKIYYQPQDWANVGSIISILSLASVLCIIFGYKLKKW